MTQHRSQSRRHGPRQLAFAVTLAAATAVGQSGSPAHADPIALVRSTIDGGGASFVQAGSYILGGTIGQPDAGRLSAGNYTLLGGFWSGGSSVVGVDDERPGPTPEPLAFRLYPSAPNPFTSGTRVAFDLPQARPVLLKIYGVDGRLVRSLIDGVLPAGHHALVWDATDDHGRKVASGVYLLQLHAGDSGARHKLAVLR